jgi:hypothetical protein
MKTLDWSLETLGLDYNSLGLDYNSLGLDYKKFQIFLPTPDPSKISDFLPNYY